MTAAHCINEDDPLDIVIQFEWPDNDSAKFRKKVSGARDVIVHPGFYLEFLHQPYPEVGNDIALILLDITAPNGVVPIALNNNAVPSGAVAYNLGYGYTKAGDPTPTNPNAFHAFGKSDVLLEGKERIFKDCSIYPPVFHDTICGGRTWQSTCVGDSGGPILVKGAKPGSDVQIGITSFGDSFCQPGRIIKRPSTKYTNVAYHYEWILKSLHDWEIDKTETNQELNIRSIPRVEMPLQDPFIFTCPKDVCTSNGATCLLRQFILRDNKHLSRGEWIHRDHSPDFYFGVSENGSVHVAERKIENQCHIIWTAAEGEMEDTNNWYQGKSLKMESGNIILYAENNEELWSAGCSNRRSLLKMTRVDKAGGKVVLVYNKGSSQKLDFWIDKDGGSFDRCGK